MTGVVNYLPQAGGYPVDVVMKSGYRKVEAIVSKYGGNRDSLVSILQDVQLEYRYLLEDALRVVAKQLDLQLIQVYGVATFFRAFSLKPRGEHIVSVCLGTACHVRGAPTVLDEVKRQLGIEPRETTKDMQFSLETVNCLGACALGSIVVVDGKYHGQMSPGKVKKVLKQQKRNPGGTGNMKKLKTAGELEQLRSEILNRRDPVKPYISVCGGTGCHAYRCEDVASALKEEIKRQGLGNEVELKMTGCHGFCERGPLVVLYPRKIFYQRVTPDDVPEIISETVLKGNIIDRLLYVDPVSGKKVYFENAVPFYKGQQRLVFGNNGLIDSTNIEDYLAIGGYSALSKVLVSMQPEEIIEEIRQSGLRGRGGGFPIARKWESCRNAPSSDGIRYVICNADEGDPGAYMDRSSLKGSP